MTFIPGIGETGPLTGPLVLGYMLSCILFGILTMQVHSYYNKYPDDKAWIKWLVGVLFLLEIVVTISTLIDGWAAFGTGWGDVNSLKVYNWSLIPMAILNSIIAALVQTFFAYRIFKLTSSVWIPIVICSMASLQCVVSFYVGIANAVRGRGFEAFYQLSVFASVSLVADAICDVLIAISTVVILARRMRQSHFRRTHTTLKRLIRLSVETGFTTASCATLELIFWQVEKFLNYHYIFFFILGKLYSNAMMAALNSRMHPESHRNVITTVDMNIRNHLTLFQDEYPESPGATIQSIPINSIHKNVAQNSGHEMEVIIPPKDRYDGMDSTNSMTSDTQV